MEFLNIGIQEFVIILIIAMIVLGPDRIITTGRKMGETIRKIRMSNTWKMLTNASRGIRNIPSMLADESGFEYEQFRKDIMGETEAIKKTLAETSDGFNSWRASLSETDANFKKGTEDAGEFAAWTTASQPAAPPPPDTFPSIAPPKNTDSSDEQDPPPEIEKSDQPEQAE